MMKKYEVGMVLVLKPEHVHLDCFWRNNRWILREVLKEPVDDCTLVSENLYTGQKVIFPEDSFSHYLDMDALLSLDCEVKKKN